MISIGAYLLSYAVGLLRKRILGSLHDTPSTACGQGPLNTRSLYSRPIDSIANERKDTSHVNGVTTV